jgi:hypothetical protein
MTAQTPAAGPSTDLRSPQIITSGGTALGRI